MCKFSAYQEDQQMRIHLIRGRKERSRMFRAMAKFLVELPGHILSRKPMSLDLGSPRPFNPTRI